MRRGDLMSPMEEGMLRRESFGDEGELSDK
jgi:hypothetical protein